MGIDHAVNEWDNEFTSMMAFISMMADIAVRGVGAKHLPLVSLRVLRGNEVIEGKWRFHQMLCPYDGVGDVMDGNLTMQTKTTAIIAMMVESVNWAVGVKDWRTKHVMENCGYSPILHPYT